MRSIFIATMILFLLTACGADAQPAAPTATITRIPATFTLTPTKAPTATTTPVESQIPKGTRIEVDTTKESWLDEFPGLEEHVRINEDGTTSFVLGDMVLLDHDGKATTSKKTEFDYTPEGTVFKFAGEDKIWVAGWEFSKNAEGKYEFVDAVRILAPRPDADGSVEDPANVLPHLNKEDTSLMDLFISQTANLDIFEDGTFSVSKRGLTPDHYIFKESSDYTGGYIYNFPVGDDGEQNKFVTIGNSASSRWTQTDSPACFINNIGTLFAVSVLDSSQKDILAKSVIRTKEYKQYSELLEKPYIFLSYLYKGEDNNDQTNIFFKQNNAPLISHIYDNGNKIKSFVGEGETILNSTLFILQKDKDKQ